MSLKQRIINYMSLHIKPINLEQLYTSFKDTKPSTIRGRLNEAVGTDFIRVSKGTYILINKDRVAIVEQIPTEIAVPNILKVMMKYSMIFLDIPYKAGGQKGGNRNISNYDLITSDQFKTLLKQFENMLEDEHSQIVHMIAGGRSSQPAVSKYNDAFKQTSLKQIAKGSYTKLKKDGKTVCNMGKYDMPPEDIYVFNHSGVLQNKESIFDFAMVRPTLPKQGGYPTMKPVQLLQQLITQATKTFDWILDPFGGSGATLQACLNTNRNCHTMDISEQATTRMFNTLQKDLKC